MKSRLPKYLFWFSDTKKLDVKKDKNFIIHQVLAYGSMKDLHGLFAIYGKKTVKKEFLKGKSGMYDPRVVALLKVVFNIHELDFSRYVKDIYKTSSGNTRHGKKKNLLRAG